MHLHCRGIAELCVVLLHPKCTISSYVISSPPAGGDPPPPPPPLFPHSSFLVFPRLS